MLNTEKHQLIMGRILQDIYSDTSISSYLGFKGGTCAYFFYNLPRFSVDLDFDLFQHDENIGKLIFERIKNILEIYGEIKDSYIKLNTIFFLLSYGDTDHNIKIEINTRLNDKNIREYFEFEEYLGILMFISSKPYMFANKLAALTSRKDVAMRDIYDIWFFAKNNWDIDIQVLKIRTGKDIKEHFSDCISIVESIKDNEILQGLGELLNEKQKIWVKINLRKETILLLKNYQSVLK